MNGIEKIVSRLEADTQAEIDVLNAETAAQCETIRREYSARAQAEYAARMQAGTAECEALRARLSGTADMETRKHLLAYKQLLISETFQEAVRQLAALPQPDYVKFLAALAAQAAVHGTEELIFNARDAKELGRDVAKAANALLGEKGRLTVAEETRKIPGGLIVRQGSVETNCAVDMLVEMQRTDLAAQVAEVLFH